jgi:hypothetical protein
MSRCADGISLCHPMRHELVSFAAIFFCGLALVPAAAHALELPNKIGLARPEYLVAQKLYRGWQFVAPIVVLALLSTGLLVAQSAGAEGSKVASITAFVCIAATQLVFWTFTFPVNRATQDWTEAPPHWEALRRKWEYSHAASFVLDLVAFVASILAVLWR